MPDDGMPCGCYWCMWHFWCLSYWPNWKWWSFKSKKQDLTKEKLLFIIKRWIINNMHMFPVKLSIGQLVKFSCIRPKMSVLFPCFFKKCLAFFFSIAPVTSRIHRRSKSTAWLAPDGWIAFSLCTKSKRLARFDLVLARSDSFGHVSLFWWHWPQFN